MNYPLYVVLVIMMVVMVLLHAVNLYNNMEPVIVPEDELVIYDNSRVPEIEPPKIITIEENELSCHETLTPCATDATCQLCQEALAKCYTFTENVILELPNGDTQVMQPGESFCLALDSKQARACNPHTGTWVMRQVDTSNYAIICHCDFPGLVIQTTIYDDCDIEVGCRPYGRLASLYTTPLECECDNGYHPDRNEHAPFCRPSVVRDVRADPAFFHRPPCRDGYVSTRHPGIHEDVRRNFEFEVCIPDPCSIDPVTGEHHEGRLVHYTNQAPFNQSITMCMCDLQFNLYPVYSLYSILDQHYGNDTVMANACIQPLTVSRHRDAVRSDIKVFWGNSSVKSNADMVFQVNTIDVKLRYLPLLVRRTTQHPRQNLSTDFIMKFQITSCYFQIVSNSDVKDIYQYWWDYNFKRRHNNNNCPLPGVGQCHRTCTTGNVSTRCNPCINNTVESSFRQQCYFVRQTRLVDGFGEIGQLCMGNTATYYKRGDEPVTYFLNGLFALDYGYGRPKENQTIYFVKSSECLADQQYQNVAVIMDSYSWYSM
ncbi:PIF-1 [Mocis latipes granulovirus]|uniref:PIF-1 n=1 Tax=Mocis latipes granulovirus TaxID=2072024 RepID=A0A162GVQ1_9BBAC|nr:PIF-1 [Mocis latipes granulovirus]AKR17436.1 PIF-1 [Mocis latipes granulovirus]